MWNKSGLSRIAGWEGVTSSKYGEVEGSLGGGAKSIKWVKEMEK